MIDNIVRYSEELAGNKNDEDFMKTLDIFRKTAKNGDTKIWDDDIMFIKVGKDGCRQVVTVQLDGGKYTIIWID